MANNRLTRLCSFIMSVPVTSRSNQILRILHMLFTASVILLIAGGVLTSSASSEGTGRTLSRAAYILLAVLLLLSTGGFLYLASLGSQVPPHGFHVSDQPPAPAPP